MKKRSGGYLDTASKQTTCGRVSTRTMRRTGSRRDIEKSLHIRDSVWSMRKRNRKHEGFHALDFENDALVRRSGWCRRSVLGRHAAAANEQRYALLGRLRDELLEWT
jgi:hypothetical protein